MSKTKVLKQINREIHDNLEVRSALYKGKVFVVAGGYIDTAFKTKRGAEGYIKRKSLVSWYDDYSQELVNAGSGLEIFEIKEEEILNAETDNIFWYLEIKRNFNNESRYSEIERQVKEIGNDSVKEYVINTLNDLRSQGERKFLKVYECKELLQDRKEELKESLNYFKEGDIAKQIKEELKEIDLKLGENKTENKEVAATQEIKEAVATEEIQVNFNEEKKGIEITFASKPSEKIREELKVNGFKWHRIKKVWYAKETESRKKFVNSLVAPAVAAVEEIKEETREEIREEKKISFENARAEEIKEEIKVKVLTPSVSKNNTKKENDKFIQERSNVDTVKITHIVKLSSEQYEKFTNTFLTDYGFLQGLGGYEEDENGKYLNGLGVLVVAAGQENLIIDPSGFSYARYVSKIVEGHELEKINIKAEDNYSKKIDEIKEDAFYIYKVGNKKEILTDDRIILNRAHNDLTLITGLTIKEKIKEGKNINVYTLKSYEGDISDYKEDLKRKIVTMFGDMFDSAIDRTDFTTRINKEIKRANIKTA